MIDMGTHKGKRVWYTGNKSMRELIEEGHVVCVPSPEGPVYKRTRSCTELELQSKYSIGEIESILEEQGRQGE